MRTRYAPFLIFLSALTPSAACSDDVEAQAPPIDVRGANASVRVTLDPFQLTD